MKSKTARKSGINDRTGKNANYKRSRKKMLSDFDVLGSWTGNYLAGNLEDPVQDADDL